MKEKVDYAADVGGGRPGPNGAVSTLVRDMGLTPIPIVPSGFTPLAPFMIGSEPKKADSLSSMTGLPGYFSFNISIAFWTAANWSGMTLTKLCSMV